MRATNPGEWKTAGPQAISLKLPDTHGAVPAIRSILLATDRSPRGEAALHRAWQLAACCAATMKQMELPPAGRPDLLRTLAAQARGADLVVLPHRRERSLAAFFGGQPVLRLLRACRCPVLIVRQARRARYGRILVGVDFSPASEVLLEAAAAVDERAALELFHAIGTRDEARLRAAEATEQAVRAYRARCLRQAQARMLTLTDSFDARRNRVASLIGRGDPARQIVVQQERCGAELVVLGKRSTSAWQDFFCGSVAQQVLAWGSSDVLVVPLAHAQATARQAAHRARGGLQRPACGGTP